MIYIDIAVHFQVKYTVAIQIPMSIAATFVFYTMHRLSLSKEKLLSTTSEMCRADHLIECLAVLEKCLLSTEAYKKDTGGVDQQPETKHVRRSAACSCATDVP